jgi:hypothetical protein
MEDGGWGMALMGLMGGMGRELPPTDGDSATGAGGLGGAAAPRWTWDGRSAGASRHFPEAVGGAGLKEISIGWSDPKSAMEMNGNDLRGSEIVIERKGLP